VGSGAVGRGSILSVSGTGTLEGAAVGGADGSLGGCCARPGQIAALRSNARTKYFIGDPTESVENS
jgi:hypothetical protein